jgi:GGDEF domain-containing protein
MAEAEISSLSLAIGDELTGLSNRRGFEMLGERLLEAARRLGLAVTAIYADLDNMKPINDQHGQDAGDRALVETAQILGSALRHSDLISRLGGDEFCAILGISVGMAEAAPGQEISLWDLTASADVAMLAAKRAKKVGRDSTETAGELR